MNDDVSEKKDDTGSSEEVKNKNSSTEVVSIWIIAAVSWLVLLFWLSGCSTTYEQNRRYAFGEQYSRYKIHETKDDVYLIDGLTGMTWIQSKEQNGSVIKTRWRQIDAPGLLGLKKASYSHKLDEY